jgi:hypothetical protein
MAVIQIKRRVTGAAGAPSSLKSGELAVNMQDHTLYLGVGDDGGGNATSIEPFGGSGSFVALSGNQTIAGVKTFSSSPILPTPAAGDNSQAAATTAFVKAQNYLSTANRVTDLTAPNATWDVNGQRITNLGTPTQTSDAVTKAYVDGLVQGLAWKQPVRAATTANITLSGNQTIDGVSVVTGDRVLVKNQTTANANGIYVAASGAWTRATDFDVSTESIAGTAMLVTEGATNGDKAFTLSTDGAITLGTTSLTFVQITSGATGEANDGLNVGTNGIGVYDSKSGVSLQFRKLYAPTSIPITLTLNGQEIDFGFNIDSTLRINSGSLGVNTTWAGQTSITTLGTIATGVWQATAIALQYGGTGANLSGLSDGSLLKKSGTAIVAATVGTDYLGPNSTIDGGTF